MDLKKPKPHRSETSGHERFQSILMDLTRSLRSPPGYLVFGAAAALGAWVLWSRFSGLDQLLIWHDEVFSIARVLGYSVAEIQRTLFSGKLLTPEEILNLQRPSPDHGWRESLAAFTEHPEHAPLYYLLGRLVIGLPLEPIIALRGLAACFGILLIPAVYALMQALFGRGPIPWVAAVIVACSPLHLLYDQEARQYSLWLLLLTLSCLALVHALRHDRTLDWSLYTLSNLAGLYTHLPFVILIAVQGVWLFALHRPGSTLGRGRRQVRRWLLANAAALLAFLPWIGVLILNQEQFQSFTGWMQRPIGIKEIVSAWADHLIATFVDLTPSREPFWWWMGVPLAWIAWRFSRSATKPAAWLILLLALAHVAVVLGPDLLVGGSRSQHVRYALPALLALELMVAWWIGRGLQSIDLQGQRWGMIGLLALLGLGFVSQTRIKQAESWSTKHFSAQNRAIAQILNRSERPLVLASSHGVSAGELIALSHWLEPQVRLWGEPLSGAQPPPLADDTPVVVLTPSQHLLLTLSAYRLRPIAGTWQWQLAEPRSAEPSPYSLSDDRP